MQLPMPAALFAVVVVLFVVVGVIVIRSEAEAVRSSTASRSRTASAILLEEAGLKVYHRVPPGSARGGGRSRHRVRAVLTDRRIILATGGPEGKHKFVILMILDYTTPALPVPESGYAAYQRKFRLEERLSDVRVLGRGRAG